jgi:formylglycine-generating enzyme required for sulfatase activity
MIAASFLLLCAGCQQAGAPSTAAENLPITRTKGGVEMVLVPAGSFVMGNRRGKEDELPAHKVSVGSFWIDRYEVAQAEYSRLGLPNPSHFKGDTLPVEQIKWDQAAFYCNARSRDEGLRPCYNEADSSCDFSADGYRLPTEAEWEYACRAGSDGDYYFGSDPRRLTDYAWYADNSEKKTHPVGQKQPNAWGLYDMLGNVGEWCNDMYGKNYYEHSPGENPHGPAEGSLYVLRGGSWNSGPEVLRSSYRVAENPGFSDACLARDAIGFRCVKKGP